MSTQPTPGPGVPAALAGLVDDAAVFPPGDLPLPEALAAHRRHRSAAYADLVGPLVLADRHLPELGRLLRDGAAGAADPGGGALRVAVVVGGGAGALEPAVRWAAEAPGVALAGLEVALADPDDLAGNTRRVVAAVNALRAAGALGEDVPVAVELPRLDPHEGPAPGAGRLGALDELAMADLALKVRTGGLTPDLFPAPEQLAGMVAAALDREVGFKCTAGLHRAARHDEPGLGHHHGFLNVWLATRASLDGAEVADVAAVLRLEDPEALRERAEVVGLDGLARTRRWFRSFGSCSVDEPLEDLVELGLLGVLGLPGPQRSG